MACESNLEVCKLAIILLIIIGVIVYQEVQRKEAYKKKQQEREFIQHDADEKLSKLRKTSFYSDVVKRIQNERPNYIRIMCWGVEVKPGRGIRFNDYGCNISSANIQIDMENKKRVAQELNRMLNYEYTIEEDYDCYVMRRRW